LPIFPLSLGGRFYGGLKRWLRSEPSGRFKKESKKGNLTIKRILVMYWDKWGSDLKRSWEVLGMKMTQYDNGLFMTHGEWNI
jgi:hypothetical protein